MILTTKSMQSKPINFYHQQNLNVNEEQTFLGVTLDNKHKFIKKIKS